MVRNPLPTSFEDGIPEILAEQRLGHQVPGMRGLYAHASQQMREKLTAALQARWEESLRHRAAIDPHSPVPLLDEPARAVPGCASRSLRSSATIGMLKRSALRSQESVPQAGLIRWLRSQE